MEIREGDALETLARDLPDTIDFCPTRWSLTLVEDRLRGGALVIADNADASPKYIARVRSAADGYLSVAFADDVELSMRLGPAAPGN